MNLPVAKPTHELLSAVQEHGRIRTGWQPPNKNYPESLSHFRFTSPDRHAIEQLAALYGGEVKAWNEPKARIKNQFEVFSECGDMEVWVPFDSIFTGYEMWSGGGCQRRCDGELVQLRQDPDDDGSTPCICNAKGVLECQPKTRLNVVIPNIDLGGVWRYESSSKYVHREMPSMAALLGAMHADSRLVFGRLVIVEKSDRVWNAKKKKWDFTKNKICRLIPSATAQQIASGEAGIPVLTAGSDGVMHAELVAGSDNGDALDVESSEVTVDAEEVVDAEVVEDQSWRTQREAFDAEGLQPKDLTKGPDNRYRRKS